MLRRSDRVGRVNYRTGFKFCNSESSTDPESSEEQSSHDRGSSEQLLVRLPNTPSLVDLQKLLEEECPKQYAVMSKRNTCTFEDWNGSKRLRIGQIQTPFDLTTSRNVYAYIGGGDNNGLRFTQGPANKKLSLIDTDIVELDLPFQDLCHSGRLMGEEEKERLRAVMCFWLLEAGHTQTMKKYEDFEMSLVDACRWLGGAAIAKASSNDENTLFIIPPEGCKPAAPVPSRTSDESALSYRKRRSVSSIKADSDSLLYTTNKRAKLEDTIAAMQRRHDEQAANLVAIQQEIMQIKPSADVTEMQRTIVTQRQDIKRLEDNVQALTSDLEEARGSVREARGKLEQEKRLRMEVERKLSEYIDAQKKMAAQFS